MSLLLSLFFLFPLFFNYLYIYVCVCVCVYILVSSEVNNDNGYDQQKIEVATRVEGL